MAIYNEVAKEELRAKIKAELIVEFGSSEEPTILDKYAHAMARAIAQNLVDTMTGYPESTDIYP